MTVPTGEKAGVLKRTDRVQGLLSVVGYSTTFFIRKQKAIECNLPAMNLLHD